VAAGFNNLYDLAVGDLNGDGKPDLAFTVNDNSNGHGVGIALGNGDGTFQAAALFPTTLQDPNLDTPYPATSRSSISIQTGIQTSSSPTLNSAPSPLVWRWHRVLLRSP